MFLICSMHARRSFGVMDSSLYQRGRLYLGAVPDVEARRKIDGLSVILRHAHRFAGKPTRPDRLHVSLLFLGSFSGSPSQELVQIAHQVGAAVRMPSFDVVLDRSVSFRGKPGQRPFVLVSQDGCAPLQSLRQQMIEALCRTGLKGRARNAFTPHVTLWYGEREVDEHPIEPIGWTVREFVLIHSLRGHTYLARWPLGV
jgi:RNA 2',3'-cyclic 3'-phosphodiesterase